MDEPLHRVPLATETEETMESHHDRLLDDQYCHTELDLNDIAHLSRLSGHHESAVF
jgi:hypothetical protein